MRFWQAVVVAQMAAGAVWVDRMTIWWLHMLADAGNVALAAIAWVIWKALFGADPQEHLARRGR